MEIWKIVNNFENYEVSNFGNIRNVKTKRLLKRRKDYMGCYVNISHTFFITTERNNIYIFSKRSQGCLLMMTMMMTFMYIFLIKLIVDQMMTYY